MAKELISFFLGGGGHLEKIYPHILQSVRECVNRIDFRRPVWDPDSMSDFFPHNRVALHPSYEQKKQGQLSHEKKNGPTFHHATMPVV